MFFGGGAQRLLDRGVSVPPAPPLRVGGPGPPRPPRPDRAAASGRQMEEKSSKVTSLRGSLHQVLIRFRCAPPWAGPARAFELKTWRTPIRFLFACLWLVADRISSSSSQAVAAVAGRHLTHREMPERLRASGWASGLQPGLRLQSHSHSRSCAHALRVRLDFSPQPPQIIPFARG